MGTRRRGKTMVAARLRPVKVGLRSGGISGRVMMWRLQGRVEPAGVRQCWGRGALAATPLELVAAAGPHDMRAAVEARGSAFAGYNGSGGAGMAPWRVDALGCPVRLYWHRWYAQLRLGLIWLSRSVHRRVYAMWGGGIECVPSRLDSFSLSLCSSFSNHSLFFPTFPPSPSVRSPWMYVVYWVARRWLAAW